MEPIATRECTGCHEVKDVTEFPRRSKKEGYRPASRCKQCTYARQKEYHRRNGYRCQKEYGKTQKGKEVHAASRREWRLKYPERFREYAKNNKRKQKQRDPKGFAEQHCRVNQISRLKKKIPDAPREIVVAIVDARRSVLKAKQALSESQSKHQQ